MLATVSPSPAWKRSLPNSANSAESIHRAKEDCSDVWYFKDFGEWEQTGTVVDRREPLGYQQVRLPESRKTAGACQRTNND